MGKPGIRAAAALAAFIGAGCGSSDEPRSDAVTDIFRDLRIEDVTSNGAVLRFDTTIETTCEAQFGLDADRLDRRAQDPNMDPENPFDYVHDVPLGGLDAETAYHVRAWAEDREGMTYLSETLRFETPAATSAEANVARASAGTSIGSVSSNFGNGSNESTWGALNAIDGSFATEWSSNGDGNDAYLELDFGQVRRIAEVRFQSRQMTDGTSIIQRLRLYGDGDEAYGSFNTPSPDVVYTLVLDPAPSTRVLRMEVEQSTGGNTGVKELQAFEAP